MSSLHLDQGQPVAQFDDVVVRAQNAPQRRSGSGKSILFMRK